MRACCCSSLPHPLAPRRPDEQFAAEAAAARELGVTVAVVDDDAARQGDPAAAVQRVPQNGGMAVYRGWMLRSEEYRLLADALAARSVTLRTSNRAVRRGPR